MRKKHKQVKLIIRAFKRNMAPQAQGGSFSSGNWFLKTPNVFKLRYRTGRKNHPFLNSFKQCFLSDMSTTIQVKVFIQHMMMEHQFL